MTFPWQFWAKTLVQKPVVFVSWLLQMSVFNITSLRGEKLPVMFGSGNMLIPVLTGDSRVKHSESWNWQTFAECVEVFKLDHRTATQDGIVLTTMSECDAKLKKPRFDLGGRTVNWFLMFLMFV